MISTQYLTYPKFLVHPSTCVWRLTTQIEAGNLGCQSPNEGWRVDRKIEVCEILSWDHKLKNQIYDFYQYRWTFILTLHSCYDDCRTAQPSTPPVQHDSTSPVILSDGYAQYLPPHGSREPYEDMKKQSNMGEINGVFDDAGGQDENAGYEVVPNSNTDNVSTPYAAVC